MFKKATHLHIRIRKLSLSVWRGGGRERDGLGLDWRGRGCKGGASSVSEVCEKLNLHLGLSPVFTLFLSFGQIFLCVALFVIMLLILACRGSYCHLRSGTLNKGCCWGGVRGN